MGVAKIYSATPLGFDSKLIEVESDATKGLPSIQIVGLANKSIDEAKERIKSAISNSLLEYPPKRITINLAPAELPKEGTHYDLPIALSVLVSSGQLRQHDVADSLFAGELALDGSLRPVRGVISIVEAAWHAGITKVYVPTQNVPQASLVERPEIIGVNNLKDLYLHLKKEKIIQPVTPDVKQATSTRNSSVLDDVQGQEQAKRALIIAAAGRHNLMLTGPPGTGKTMLAQTLTNLLPDLLPSEKVATTKMHSLNGESIDQTIESRPFRAPHHTASRASLIGGGSRPQPGEISLAHLGVLFLDEIPEYPRASLEALRQPLEDRKISISRANGKLTYPADFMLIATMNPCPCGYYGDEKRECGCSTTQIVNYQKKLSGPLIDRIDMTVTVSRIPNEKLLNTSSYTNKQHQLAQAQIESVTEIQRNRYKGSGKYNSNLSSREINQHVQLDQGSKHLLSTATEKLQLSARSYFKIIKLARTIADLEGSPAISTSHIAEALQYRTTVQNL